MDLRRNSMKLPLSLFATTFLIVTMRHFGMDHYRSPREGVLLHLFLKAMSISQIWEMAPYISTLNIDYKILTKALAKRMEQYLPKLVHSDQTGVVNGRYISPDIRLLCDLLKYSDVKNVPGFFLFCWLWKGIWHVRIELYNETTEVFHFGPNLRGWFYVVYNGVQSCVINGGYMTSYFEISRGVRRGAH